MDLEVKGAVGSVGAQMKSRSLCQNLRVLQRLSVIYKCVPCVNGVL